MGKVFEFPQKKVKRPPHEPAAAGALLGLAFAIRTRALEVEDFKYAERFDGTTVVRVVLREPGEGPGHAA